ncbi:MAG: HAD family acid phosphatase [Candidatus Didemnitutus sp.]|nr:HAD family acid phosphatase [Candidatus Didemnitutus sp.]
MSIVSPACLITRIHLRRTSVALALWLGACASANTVPVDTAQTPAELHAYVRSGQYEQDIRRIAGEATAWMNKRVSSGDERLVAVFDLDETLLSNLPLLEQSDFDSSTAPWTEWEAGGNAPPIQPVADLLCAARAAGVRIVLLTGRRERQRAATLRNLGAIGLGCGFELWLKPDDERGPTSEFKALIQREMTERGAVIILNIGDQPGDFVGGFSEREFKLPNPFYVTK